MSAHNFQNQSIFWLNLGSGKAEKKKKKNEILVES